MSESAALFVGDLVVRLIVKTGPNCAPILPALLEAAARRLTTAKSSTFIQQLVVVFAQLLHHQLDNVINFMYGQLKVDGKTGLEVLLEAWCQNSGYFVGDFPIKVW